MLKRTFRWIVVMICINMTAYTVCQREDGKTVIELKDKFYIKTDQISLLDNKIFIQVDDLIYETPALYSDQNGFFIDKIASSGDCAWYQWECRKVNCRTCNQRGIDYKCRKCGFPMSG